MKEHTIVLVTKGKLNYTPATSIIIHLFSDRKKAIKYCKDVTDMERKYWTRAEIIDEGTEYEPCWEGNL